MIYEYLSNNDNEKIHLTHQSGTRPLCHDNSGKYTSFSVSDKPFTVSEYNEVYNGTTHCKRCLKSAYNEICNDDIVDDVNIGDGKREDRNIEYKEPMGELHLRKIDDDEYPLQLNADNGDDYVEIISSISRENREIYVYGIAGTGKSYTLANLASKLSKTKTLTVLSPTHAAKKVIGSMLSSMGVKVNQIATVASYIGLGLEEDMNDPEAKSEFKIKSDGLEPTDYILVDEVSMTDTEYIEKILLESPYSKIIYFGDIMQLLPVKGKLYEKLDNIPRIELCKQYRQELAGSNLSNSISSFIKEIKDRSATFGRVSFDNNDDTIKMVDTLIESYCSGDIEVIGCFKNATVIAYNEAIHTRLTGSSEINIGDELLLYEPLMKNSNIGGKQVKSVVANNGDTVKVVGKRVGTEFYENGITKYDFEINGIIHKNYGITDPLENNHKWNLFEKLFPSRKNNRLWWRFKDEYIDARLPYARTVWKLQGLTVDSIGLNTEDIQSAMFDYDMYNRMMYVGLSRARKSVYLLE